MHELTIFKQKKIVKNKINGVKKCFLLNSAGLNNIKKHMSCTKFWKATIINTIFIAIFLSSTFGYMFLFKQSTQKMQETEFMKLKLTDATDMLKYSNEIITTTPVINRIYLEWLAETLAYAIIITLSFAFFYGNTLSVLNNNKWLNKKEFKQFLGFSIKFFATTFAIIVSISLISRTKAIPFLVIILLIIFYLLLLTTSAQTLIHKTTFLRAITKNSLHKILPRFIISIIILIIITTITGYLLSKQPKIAITTNAMLAIIWTTWMANETLKCTKPDK